MDTIDVDYINYFYGTSMCSRSRISDIIQYHQYLIILSRKGACQVLDGQTYRVNDELLLVTYRQIDGQNILQCRSVPIE